MATSGLRFTKQTAAGFAISSMIFLMMYLALFNFASQNEAAFGLGGVVMILVINVLFLLPNYFCFRKGGWISFWKHMSVGALTSILGVGFIALLIKDESWMPLIFVAIFFGIGLVMFQISAAVFWFTAIRGCHEG